MNEPLRELTPKILARFIHKIIIIIKADDSKAQFCTSKPSAF